MEKKEVQIRDKFPMKVVFFPFRDSQFSDAEKLR